MPLSPCANGACLLGTGMAVNDNYKSLQDQCSSETVSCGDDRAQKILVTSGFDLHT